MPVLEAIGIGQTDLDLEALDPLAVRNAVEHGLGAILAHVSRDSAHAVKYPLASEIRAADLTARLLSADLFDAIGQILRRSETDACRPLLIKGAAMALLHYPAPHLRTMGDVDICVPPVCQPDFEAMLGALGFTQASRLPPEFFERHHHSMPFWHPAWGVWVEVHTRLFPPNSALNGDQRFELVRLEAQLETVELCGSLVRVMNRELQLIYTCARWLEGFDAERGVFPVLDVVLLMRSRDDSLDWNRLFVMLEESPSVVTAAVHTMLSFLGREGIVALPRAALDRLASGDRYTNRLSRRILHHIMTIFLFERRSYGRFLTARNVNIVWSTLLRSPSPIGNLLRIPFDIAFPPGDPRRFDPTFAAQRLARFLFGSARGDPSS